MMVSSGQPGTGWISLYNATGLEEIDGRFRKTAETGENNQLLEVLISWHKYRTELHMGSTFASMNGLCVG
jgi:competence transcription factor ComK